MISSVTVTENFIFCTVNFFVERLLATVFNSIISCKGPLINVAGKREWVPRLILYFTEQGRIQRPVKHLGWSALQK